MKQNGDACFIAYCRSFASNEFSFHYVNTISEWYKMRIYFAVVSHYILCHLLFSLHFHNIIHRGAFTDVTLKGLSELKVYGSVSLRTMSFPSDLSSLLLPPPPPPPPPLPADERHIFFFSYALLRNC